MNKKLKIEYVAFVQEMIDYLEMKLQGWRKEYAQYTSHAIVLTAERKLAKAQNLLQQTDIEIRKLASEFRYKEIIFMNERTCHSKRKH